MTHKMVVRKRGLDWFVLYGDRPLAHFDSHRSAITMAVRLHAYFRRLA